MPSKSGARGRATFEIHGDIVRLQVEGPWNEQLVVESHAALNDRIAALAKGRWGMMVVVSGSMVFGPEAMEAIRRAAHDEATKKGRTATAWVIPPGVGGGSLFRNLVGVIYEPSHPVEVFDAEEPARAWLAQELARARA